MSKKLAIGTDLILLDVKVGSGAFMKTVEDAGELAEACAALARDWGRAAGWRSPTCPAARHRGQRPGRRRDRRAAPRPGPRPAPRGRARLRRRGPGPSPRPGRRRGGTSRRARLDGGDALETFRRMVEAQGGDPRVVDDPAGTLPAAPVVRPITARSDVPGLRRDEAIRPARISAGRRRKGDPIDLAVGIVFGRRSGTGSRPAGNSARCTRDEDAAAARGRGPGRLGVVRGAGRARAARARLVRVARRAGGGGWGGEPEVRRVPGDRPGAEPVPARVRARVRRRPPGRSEPSPMGPPGSEPRP